MSGDTQKTSTSTGSSNPAITSLVSNLAGKTNTALNAGPHVFGQSLYGGVGDTTKNSWASALGAAGNQNYSNGVNGAISSFADTAAGKNFGTNDPGYATLRAKAGNDALTSVNSSFNNSGMFGSDGNQRMAGEGVTNALAGMDYTNYQNDIQRQQQAAGMLPALYQAGQMPGATQGAVGAAQDANSQAALLGQNDLFRRTNDAQLNHLAQTTSILGGQAGAAGNTTTTTSPTPPWWQSALGLGVSLL